MLVVAIGVLHLCLLDGIHGTIASLVHGHDTQYAETYSSSAFMQVHSGMSTQEVVDILGEPLHRFSVTQTPAGPKVTCWQYTLNRDPTNSNFRMRALLFEKGTVTRKEAQFCKSWTRRKEQ